MKYLTYIRECKSLTKFMQGIFGADILVKTYLIKNASKNETENQN